ncbi:hypothetical protein DCAR_0830783 [Daucus carota subsp. sativus]|uniref:Uncharacterized protein n=1 Tax=Daucus carota subsp. sativus TaxID=79200 RepID=A0AAF1BBS7_DAUCS|nr:hypothetical protein DCAR_0830783 [Daucus carota subsp. sativus]
MPTVAPPANNYNRKQPPPVPHFPCDSAPIYSTTGNAAAPSHKQIPGQTWHLDTLQTAPNSHGCNTASRRRWPTHAQPPVALPRTDPLATYVHAACHRLSSTAQHPTTNQHPQLDCHHPEFQQRGVAALSAADTNAGQPTNNYLPSPSLFLRQTISPILHDRTPTHIQPISFISQHQPGHHSGRR